MKSDEVRRLALGCLLPSWVGPRIPSWIADGLAGGLAGVVLFGSNLGDGSQLRVLTDQLRATAGRDLVLALDEEGGDVTRLDTTRGSTVPGAAALGALDDEATTEAVYTSIGNRLVEAGITLNLAPVADVNNNPANPVIGVRSFSADPKVAARSVAAAVRGLQRCGVAACVKHFPGHGDTAVDSHRDVAVITGDAHRLETLELLPFRAAIQAQARAVMTGHLLVPAFDGHHLATVSPAVNTDLLRDRLGFTGAIVTDALEMQALAGSIGMVEGFVQALISGADTIELGARDYPELLSQIPDAVVAAVAQGRLLEQRLDDAAAATARLSTAGSLVAIAPDLVTSASARSLSVRGVIGPLRSALLIECRSPNGVAAGDLPWGLAEPLAATGIAVRTRTAVDAASAQTAADAIRHADEQVVLVVRDPARFDWQRELIDAVSSLPSGRSVVVDAGWPTELNILNSVPVIVTRGVAPVLLRQVAQLLVPHTEWERS